VVFGFGDFLLFFVVCGLWLLWRSLWLGVLNLYSDALQPPCTRTVTFMPGKTERHGGVPPPYFFKIPCYLNPNTNGARMIAHLSDHQKSAVCTTVSVEIAFCKTSVTYDCKKWQS